DQDGPGDRAPDPVSCRGGRRASAGGRPTMSNVSGSGHLSPSHPNRLLAEGEQAPANTVRTAGRVGLIVLIASFAGHAGNYLYYLIAARMVTPPEFAAISALIALGTIVWMPINGVQLAVARDVAVLRTSGTSGELSAYLRRLGRRTGAMVLAVLAVV